MSYAGSIGTELTKSFFPSTNTYNAQFTPPKRTRHRQDSFVVSGVAVLNSFNRAINTLINISIRPHCSSR